ncbi:MAG: arginine decarboxylase [Bdellovibrionales bacterium CG10_big_fil_rev_8_21_14_0_10_45_34]|nr:MAG: arginine decarboxylase [Bdellovibrionales bacterium CG10_big_fil_rev_8_21_14_0_10_45_34]
MSTSPTTENQVRSVSTTSEAEWTRADSSSLYGVDLWGAGYFRVNERGNVSVTPKGEKGPQVDLTDLVADLMDRGIRPPILIRFPDIVRSRVELLAGCFQNAITEYGYKGLYKAVYPIKVNQQRHLVSAILESGRRFDLGLECGSKPELLVALALMDNPDALLICNGFKDAEYVETAILARKLGRKAILVVDRASELPLIIEKAKKLNATPKIGLRAKLDSKGAGRWVESSGAKSKFGLTSTEMVEALELLKRENMLEMLELVHFHIGSQITSIQAIKASLNEGARFFCELHKLGAPLKYIDVGGGLGVDYDGSSSSNSSINYSEQEYANDVTFTILRTCDEMGIPHPNIITEAGRALVAHHSVLIFNVLGVNELSNAPMPSPAAKEDHRIVQSLYEILSTLKSKNLVESFHDVQQLKNDTLQLFNYGYLSLEQRSKAEAIIRSILRKMSEIIEATGDFEELKETLSADQTDTYFCNFSVFQSVPDSWAVGHVFPVMPIQCLNDKPTKRCVLVDLTCDSDGKIDTFSEQGVKKNYLEVHRMKPNEPYYMGVFLIGAYQEILGDLHNLFGDTDAVLIGISEAGYTVNHVEEGDTVAEVLSYLQYNKTELCNSVRQATERSIQEGQISKNEARLLMRNYEENLTGYTYLEEPDELMS